VRSIRSESAAGGLRITSSRAGQDARFADGDEISRAAAMRRRFRIGVGGATFTEAYRSRFGKVRATGAKARPSQVIFDDEPPTRPDTRITICPKCQGAKGLPIEDGLRRCDLCHGEGRMEAETAREWRIRNE